MNRHPGAHEGKDKESEELRVEKLTGRAGGDQSKEQRELEEREESTKTGEPAKLTPWAMGHKEEQSRGKRGGQSKGAFKKLESKVRELWRTTTPEERAGAPVGRRNPETIGVHQEGSNASPQYINLQEPRVDTSVPLTPSGSRPSADLGTGSLGALKVAQTSEEGPASSI